MMILLYGDIFHTMILMEQYIEITLLVYVIEMSIIHCMYLVYIRFQH